MINLALSSSVRLCPGEFMDLPVSEEGAADDGLFSPQRLMTLSPLFVMSTTPCFPMSLFLLLHPTLATWSHSKSKTSCR